MTSDAFLLPTQRRRYASVPSQSQKKTKGRKAFLGLCHATSLLVPIDINDEATCMQESSLGRLKQAVQEMAEKRKSIAAHRGAESNDAGPAAQVGGVGSE